MPARLFVILRILHLAFIVSQFLFVVVLFVLKTEDRDRGMLFQLFFVVLGFVNIALALVFVKNRIIAEAEARLIQAPQDPMNHGELIRGYVVAFALCESAGIFGLALRFLGGTWPVPAALFGLALFGLVLLTPRQP